MDGAQREGVVLFLDHAGDVPLRGALRDHEHVDARLAQGAEEPPGHPRRAVHVLPDHRHDEEVAEELEALDTPAPQLGGELVGE